MNLPVSRRVLALGAAMAFAAVAGFAYRFLTFVEFSNDDFLHLALARQIVGGALPVRDFVERGLPLMTMASALGQLAWGEGLRAELNVVGAAYALTAALTVFLAARVSGSIAVGIVMGLAIVVSHPVSYSYPKLLAYAIGLTAIWAYGVAPSRARLAIVAASIVAAFLFRHDHGVILGAGALAAIAARHGLGRPSAVHAAWLGVMGVLLVAPYVAWVQAYQGVGAYVSDSIAFSKREAEKATWGTPPALGVDRRRPLIERFRVGPVVNVRWAPGLDAAAIAAGERRHALTRQDPVGPQTWQYALSDWSPAALEALVRDPQVADTHKIDRSRFVLQDTDAPTGLRKMAVRVYKPGEGLRLQSNAIAILYYLVWALPLAAAVVVGMMWRRWPEPVRTVVAAAILIQLGMDLTMLRDPLFNRIREVLVPASLLVAFLSAALSRTGTAGRTFAAVGLCAMMTIAGIVGGFTTRMEALPLDGGLGVVGQRARAVRYQLSPPQHRTGGRLGENYVPLVDYIRMCTPEGSRLFIMTFAPELLVYTGRQFAGGHVAMTPGYFVTEDHARLMVQRLSQEDVPLVILDSQTRQEMAAQYPRVMEYVATRYHDVARFPMGSDKHFDVLADNRRPVRRRVGDGSLPCFL